MKAPKLEELYLARFNTLPTTVFEVNLLGIPFKQMHMCGGIPKTLTLIIALIIKMDSCSCLVRFPGYLDAFSLQLLLVIQQDFISLCVTNFCFGICKICHTFTTPLL